MIIWKKLDLAISFFHGLKNLLWNVHHDIDIERGDFYETLQKLVKSLSTQKLRISKKTFSTGPNSYFLRIPVSHSGRVLPWPPLSSTKVLAKLPGAGWGVRGANHFVECLRVGQGESATFPITEKCELPNLHFAAVTKFIWMRVSSEFLIFQNKSVQFLLDFRFEIKSLGFDHAVLGSQKATFRIFLHLRYVR